MTLPTFTMKLSRQSTIRLLLVALPALLAGGISSAWAQETAAEDAAASDVKRYPAPTAVTAVDDEEDKAGDTLLVKWRVPAKADIPAGLELVGYQLMTAEEGEEFEPAVTAPPDAESAPVNVYWRRAHRVKVVALYAPADVEWYAPGDKAPEDDEEAVAVEAIGAASTEVGPVRPVGKWYDTDKTNVLVSVLLYGTIVLLCLAHARRGDMYIRPIAGLEAVEDAVGRATEMGRPMLFVSGLSGIGSISTIASMLVLGHLAKRTAAYETPILVPCYDPLVMAAEREIVREAYLEAGRPQSFRPENIFYVTDSQFGYVAAVDGIMLREKPAANFYVGYFYAESLILAETGNMSGAIQIAATDSDTQIPFFITACDYTLMGEELYAASAYLSRHPTLLAQLKAQDIGKAIMMVALILGAIAVTVGALGVDRIAEFVLKLFAT